MNLIAKSSVVALYVFGFVLGTSSAFAPSTGFIHRAYTNINGYDPVLVNKNTWPLYYVKPEEGKSQTEQQSDQKTLEDYVKDRGGDRVIRKVLIANNGMAATKSILSMRQWAYYELGDAKAIQFVAMATPEDIKANAEFVRLADSYVEVPGGKNCFNYANVTVISQVAQEQGVDAVWPGWGHASENPQLPATLNEMGIKFIGPTSPVMSVLGDKIAANILAQTAGLPVVPWSGSYGGENDGPLVAELTPEGTIPQETFEKGTCRTVEEAVEVARRIGYENGIMIKASEGGGGKGIRLVYSEEDLPGQFLQVQNEVVGSPIFLMQLCQNNRHIEIQIVGDEHGNAVAFSGRDCSTQRRFQKIFEEAPPRVVPPETFREMEKNAQKLTQSIGYQGAGTVEYLYNADEDKFYFLELNPRLQVEHPVTESITDVNLPATQLQCAMGIPLNNIPEVRRFYGKDDIYGNDPIDFMEEDYPPVKKHCIAARITAENPDEGFKPTAGKIERIKFQSAGNVWGYFAYGPNGGIHEFADSQFGHVFAKGASREEARKALILSLKEMEVRGEIRTTFEYLEQLLETDHFKANKVTTSWLDGLLKEKAMETSISPHLVVVSAAAFNALDHIKEGKRELESSLAKGQVSTSLVDSITSYDIEVPYKNVRYPFHVEMIGSDVYRLTLGGKSSIDVKIREEPSGALIAHFGGEMHRLVGRREALGVRLNVDGQTIYIPNIKDPSELRSDVTGKVVRYLHENGAIVAKGAPFIEVEAMKMIMTMSTEEAGKIKHELSPGTVIAAGDLLASLELEDPSKVDKIETFDGKLEIDDSPIEREAGIVVTSILEGYVSDPDAAAQNAFAEAGNTDAILRLVTNSLEEYLRVEKIFDGRVEDEVVAELTKADDLSEVLALIRAHKQREIRSNLILSMLRQVSEFRSRYGLDRLPATLLYAVREIESLKDKQYGDIKLCASEIIEESNQKPFDERVKDLRSRLLQEGGDLSVLVGDPDISAGVDLLTYLFSDDNGTVRANAAELYVRRIHRSRRLIDVNVEESNGHLACSWSYQNTEKPESQATTRHGMLMVLPNFDGISNDLQEALSFAGSKMDGKDKSIPFFSSLGNNRAVNDLFIASGASSDGVDIAKLEDTIAAQGKKLKMLGVRSVTALQPIEKQHPLYYTFTSVLDWKEDSTLRDVRPTFYSLLELPRVKENFELEKLHAVGKSVQVYVGTEKTDKPVRGGPPQVVFVRGVSGTQGISTPAGAERALLQGLDELERAQLSSKVDTVKSSSRIYLHSTIPLENTTPEELSQQFSQIIGALKSRYANRLLKLRVDEIEVLLSLDAKSEDGEPMTKRVRLLSSSLSGEWLSTKAYEEILDPDTGVFYESCITDDDEHEYCLLDHYGTANEIQRKRSIARKVGSTYAYDFLGLLEVGLLGQWNNYLKSASANGDAIKEIPASCFKAKELVEGPGGNLVLSSRPIGENKVGMLAWQITMKTPEYPEGRDFVLIANDVTVKSGSFSVEEDEVYFKASEYAREMGIPRIYFSCNAGARIGLYQELMEMIRVKPIDNNAPSKGFEYLYVSDEDYKLLPEGAVIAHQVNEGWAIDDIIGTTFGIGVENLQGSGKIAGETSQAYNDVFTLSYVTGRSVGIGAYLVRLGQRIIQKNQGPIILTGYSALNKLLGREVYSSQDQLGGPQIMVPNGVSHLQVESDQDGVAAVLEWLSYVPKYVGALPACHESPDPVSRKVQWRPPTTPYDPRLLLAGTKLEKGFFDSGSFKEYLAGWGKTVVVGRGRLGGIPMGAIAVETRGVMQRIPADPANPASSEQIQPQAGQVLYPDSSYKMAQTIRDFNNEGLPLMIFANWRGFSGGSRDMFGEVLKFGSMIVDALREYENPVYIYMPPHAELRGGSWVVVDPTINKEKMEMYADPDSRGGILEPNGIAEIKFRSKDQLALMHRADPELQMLDTELSTATEGDQPDSDVVAEIKKQIADREEVLKPLYLQAATEFCDLHDKTGRMKAVGVIRDAVPWDKSREYFYNRVKRRMLEDMYLKRMVDASDGDLDNSMAVTEMKAITSADWDDDAAMVQYYIENESVIEGKINSIRGDAIKERIKNLEDELNKFGGL